VRSVSDSGAQNDGDAAVEPLPPSTFDVDTATAGVSSREVVEHTHSEAASDTAAGADAEAAKASREQTVSIHIQLVYTTTRVPMQVTSTLNTLSNEHDTVLTGCTCTAVYSVAVYYY
jgi:hypothetical protein